MIVRHSSVRWDQDTGRTISYWRLTTPTVVNSRLLSTIRLSDIGSLKSQLTA